jgi:sugar phosphate isomerase/epimerase
LNILHNRIALHTWTLDTTPLADVLRIARDTDYNGVELRHVDFMRGRKAGMSEQAMVKLVRDAHIKVAVIGTESGVMFADGDELKRLLDSLRYVSEKAVALGCDVIMVSPGQNAPGGMAVAKRNLRTCAEVTAEYGIKIALEFNSRHPLIRTLEHGMEVVDGVNLPNCGLLLDTYHLHCSGGNGTSFRHVPVDRIFTFQFSDAPPGPLSDTRQPVDRLPPGKGVVPFVEIFKTLMAMGYQGYMSYEAPNPAQWNRPPDGVAREGVTLVRELLAQAEQRA